MWVGTRCPSCCNCLKFLLRGHNSTFLFIRSNTQTPRRRCRALVLEGLCRRFYRVVSRRYRQWRLCVFYRNDRAYEKYQLDAYKSRVDLKNPYTNQGDYSIIVKNLTVNDTAVYCCKLVCGHLMAEGRVVRTYVSLAVSPKVQYNSGDSREISPIALLTFSCIITVALL